MSWIYTSSFHGLFLCSFANALMLLNVLRKGIVILLYIYRIGPLPFERHFLLNFHWWVILKHRLMICSILNFGHLERFAYTCNNKMLTSYTTFICEEYMTKKCNLFQIKDDIGLTKSVLFLNFKKQRIT